MHLTVARDLSVQEGLCPSPRWGTREGLWLLHLTHVRVCLELGGNESVLRHSIWQILEQLQCLTPILCCVRNDPGEGSIASEG